MPFHQDPFRPEAAQKLDGSDVENEDGQTAPAEQEEPVATGSAKEVLDWVGDDKDRAQRALDAEESHGDKARKGLVKDLKSKIESE